MVPIQVDFIIGFVVGVCSMIVFELIVEMNVAKGFRRGYSAALKKHGIEEGSRRSKEWLS